MQWTYEQLANKSAQDLEAILRDGESPDINNMIGWEYKGWNVQPAILKPFLGVIQKFAKGFYRDAEGVNHGYNVPVKKSAIDESWSYKPSDESPKRFGFYTIVESGDDAHGARYPNALYLDYDVQGNGLFEGKGWWGTDAGLKDYVVRANAGSDEILVGKAYYHLPPLRPGVGFFIAQRDREHDFKGNA